MKFVRLKDGDYGEVIINPIHILNISHRSDDSCVLWLNDRSETNFHFNMSPSDLADDIERQLKE